MTISEFDNTPEHLNALSKNTLVAALGIEFLEPENGNMRARMPVDHRTVQPLGILHGGASVALAETLGSTASYQYIDIKTQIAVGQSINANHIRGTREGYVIATAIPVHIGRGSHVWDINVTQDEKLICSCRLTMAIRSSSQLPGKKQGDTRRSG